MKLGSIKSYRSFGLADAGFNLIELMIAVLIFSALGISVTSYLRKNQSSMSSADITSDVQTSALLVQKMLADDIRQVAYINPGCRKVTGGYPATPSTATVDCADLKVFGGVTPLPGVTQSDLTATNAVGLPSNISASTASLSRDSDAVRLAVFDFATAFNCKLNSYASTNPSTTAGAAAGAEVLNVLYSGCNGNLTTWGLYMIVESISGTVYSNVFQITAMATNSTTATSTNQIAITAASGSSIFNQVGGLGLSGFSGAARIYPIKLIEWALEPGSGLYRREIKPTSSNHNGFGSWSLIQENVESLQFYPVTVTNSTATEHQRTMTFLSYASPDTTDYGNGNGIEDIRGVSPRVIIKSAKAAATEILYDNSITSTVENDHYPRKEMKFYVDIQNTHTN